MSSYFTFHYIWFIPIKIHKHTKETKQGCTGPLSGRARNKLNKTQIKYLISKRRKKERKEERKKERNKEKRKKERRKEKKKRKKERKKEREKERKRKNECWEIFCKWVFSVTLNFALCGSTRVSKSRLGARRSA